MSPAPSLKYSDSVNKFLAPGCLLTCVVIWDFLLSLIFQVGDYEDSGIESCFAIGHTG